MKILLTNDDGVKAEGLVILNQVLSKYHETYIIAPDGERSACSNIFTMRDEIIVKKIADRTFSISGYPADCVSLGIHSDLIPEIDLVISGINHGPNLGDDIHFSGTVAGARTAFIFGKPGIAFSIDSFHKASPNMPEASEFIADFIKKNTIKNDTFLNINYPDLTLSEISGVKYTFLSKRYYRDNYLRREMDLFSSGMSLQGHIDTEYASGSDDDAIKNRFISITPLKIDSTDYDVIKQKMNIPADN